MAICANDTISCAKSPRARVYCMRSPCLQSMSAMADLPQPDVKADVRADVGEDGPTYTVDVVLSHDNKARSYSSTAPTTDHAIKGVVEQILVTTTTPSTSSGSDE